MCVFQLIVENGALSLESDSLVGQLFLDRFNGFIFLFIFLLEFGRPPLVLFMGSIVVSPFEVKTSND